MTQTKEAGDLDRRQFIATGSVVAAGFVAASLPALTASPADATSAYFKHGLASGDPLPTAVVLWTRLTPTSASAPGSGQGP